MGGEMTNVTTSQAPTPGEAEDWSESDGEAGSSRALAPPRPVRPRPAAWLLYQLGRALQPNPAWRALSRTLERRPAAHRRFLRLESSTKGDLFGCRMCAQCALPVTGYVCPMTCPKQLRNGPCGGVNTDGGCEVYPDRPCVWVLAYERTEGAGHGADMERFLRPIDQSRWGQSSWVSYWQGRDAELWTEVTWTRRGGDRTEAR
ncbi:MAG: methylenetetrahydrofolate reductase C-terminal domain-containing protein [Acidimicrobiales bacterium]|nr:methylenetetrahydrofolate reductase C-terminal domain-containing protein [Acidimicrobiales bacterium]